MADVFWIDTFNVVTATIRSKILPAQPLAFAKAVYTGEGDIPTTDTLPNIWILPDNPWIEQVYVAANRRMDMIQHILLKAAAWRTEDRLNPYGSKTEDGIGTLTAKLMDEIMSINFKTDPTLKVLRHTVKIGTVERTGQNVIGMTIALDITHRFDDDGRSA